jgi:hypothetical protein
MGYQINNLKIYALKYLEDYKITNLKRKKI